MAIALEFNELLRIELSSEQWFEICDRNRKQTDWNTCASHDFCDANVWMARAIKTVLGIRVKPSKQEHTDIWNRAWDMAKTLQIAPRPRAIIIIDGGNCAGVRSNVDLSVDVLDRDNEEATDPKDRKEFNELDAECDQLDPVY